MGRQRRDCGEQRRDWSDRGETGETDESLGKQRGDWGGIGETGETEAGLGR